MVRVRETKKPTPEDIERFASGAENATVTNHSTEKKAQVARTTISLPIDLLQAVEDMARDNKRAGLPNKSTSAIVKAALEKYLRS